MKVKDPPFLGIRGFEQMLNKCISLSNLFLLLVKVCCSDLVSAILLMISVMLLPVIGNAEILGVGMIGVVRLRIIERLSLVVVSWVGRLQVSIMLGRSLFVRFIIILLVESCV